jgi:hypothetical protein
MNTTNRTSLSEFMGDVIKPVTEEALVSAPMPDIFMEQPERVFTVSMGASSLRFYRKDGHDGRFVVRYGDVAVASFGTEKENYSLKRLQVASSELDGPLFDAKQLDNGSLIELDEIPGPLENNATTLVDDFYVIAELLMNYNLT